MELSDFRDINFFLFDMDGTLYLGDRIFPFTCELLETIRSLGKRFIFFTNNSSKSAQNYAEKMCRIGISVTADDVMTSGMAAAEYLKRKHPGATVYVCGTKALVSELEGEGITVTSDIDGADCILMGNDTELTFKKLYDVSRRLTISDITYLATNVDWVCPTEFGFVPDCGSFCEMIFRATGKRPIFIGKPSQLMVELAMAKFGFCKSETAVIGDRIYTDVKSGLAAGAKGVLVMSGETDEETLKNSTDKPDIVLKDAGEILKVLKSIKKA